jgi:hypothetical protein
MLQVLPKKGLKLRKNLKLANRCTRRKNADELSKIYLIKGRDISPVDLVKE